MSPGDHGNILKLLVLIVSNRQPRIQRYSVYFGIKWKKAANNCTDG